MRAAESAFPGWADALPRERARAILRIADVIGANRGELGRIESLNVGKPLRFATGEMATCSDNLRFFAGAARNLSGVPAGEYARGLTSMVRREPIGVIGQIAPWNYPLMMAVWKFGPAVATGNTVVLKPSEQTPLTLLRLMELIEGILPAGVLNVITGDGEPVGAGIVRHPRVRMVSLTGDVATGKEVARAASASLKRVHLELGGKAPVIVFDDADLEPSPRASATPASTTRDRTARRRRASSRARACTTTCSPRSSRRSETLQYGDPLPDRQRGHQIDPGRIDHGKRVSASSSVRPRRAPRSWRAAAAAAPRAPSSSRRSSRASRRTARSCSARCSAPSSPCSASPRRTRRSAGRTASTTASPRPSGRATSAARCARALQFGSVWINAHGTGASEMPHGGFKQSGYGKDKSIYAVEEYTNIKHVGIS